MEKILVATDGSANAERALLEAKKHAQCSGGEITILTIVESLGYQTIFIDDALNDLGESAFKNTLKLFDDFNGVVNTKLKKGHPADEILKEAENGDYDLIVMGSRGLGAFSRTILGSVSNKVLNHAKTNVLIVK